MYAEPHRGVADNGSGSSSEQTKDYKVGDA